VRPTSVARGSSASRGAARWESESRSATWTGTPDGLPSTLSRVLAWIGIVGLVVGAVVITLMVAQGDGEPGILVLAWPLAIVFGGMLILREVTTRRKR
jgi:hypothetical protein